MSMIYYTYKIVLIIRQCLYKNELFSWANGFMKYGAHLNKGNSPIIGFSRPRVPYYNN